MNKNLKERRSPPEISAGKNIPGKGVSKCKGPEAGVGPGAIRNSREAWGKGGVNVTRQVGGVRPQRSFGSKGDGGCGKQGQ